MVNSPKTRQVANGLDARGKAESKSIQAYAVFAEICARLSTKQIGDLMAHRVLKEGPDQRPVTRDLMVKAMDAANLDEAVRTEYWERYFGGDADSIAEHVRRRMILAGGREEYAEQTTVSVSVISGIFRNCRVTRDALETLMAHESFPWHGVTLNDRWKRENEAHFRECFGMNELGARVETLFEMHPNATRIQWVEKDNPPESLKEYSQNQRRIMMSQLRHGETTTWEDADRVLLGLGCTLKERMEVAQVWLKENNKPRRERAVSDSAGGSEAPPSDDTDTPVDDKLDLESIPFLPQSGVPYPEELASKPDLEIITMLLMRFTGNAMPEDGTIEESIDNALRAERDLGRMIEVLSKTNLTIAEFRQFKSVFTSFVGNMTDKRAGLLEAYSYVESHCRHILEGTKDPVYERIQTIVDHFRPPTEPKQHVMATAVPETVTLSPKFTGMMIAGNSIAQPAKGSTPIKHMLDLLTRPLMSAVAVHEALPAFKATLNPTENRTGTKLHEAIMYVEMHCAGVVRKSQGVEKRAPVFERLAYIVEELKALRASRNAEVEQDTSAFAALPDGSLDSTDEVDEEEEAAVEDEVEAEKATTEDEVEEEEVDATEDDVDEEEVDATEDEEEPLPDFTNVVDVWQVAEYLGNFWAEESAGYGHDEKGHRAIAEEIARRAPLQLNDLATAIKVLAYCFADDSVEGHAVLADAVRGSIEGLRTSNAEALSKMAACLAEEPRLKHYLINLRDADGVTPVILASVIDLQSLEKTDVVDVHDLMEQPRDFEDEFLPKAPVAAPAVNPKKKKTRTRELDDAAKAQLQSEFDIEEGPGAE